MNFCDWEPIYISICSDMGYDPLLDDMSARALLAVTQNSDVRDDDSVAPLVGRTATVLGASAGLEADIASKGVEGTVIASGSAVGRALSAGVRPDIVVTDLDGDVRPQIDACNGGTLTVILAHGDNSDLVRAYAPLFKGPIVPATQGKPFGILRNYGGFTDGDRAVCLADEFGAEDIRLLGFDFETPYPKEGSDPEVKRRKLVWARRIISDVLRQSNKSFNDDGVRVTE